MTVARSGAGTRSGQASVDGTVLSTFTALRAAAGEPHAEPVCRFAIVKLPESTRVTSGAPDASTAVTNATPAWAGSPTVVSAPTSTVTVPPVPAPPAVPAPAGIVTACTNGVATSGP